jgi:hypothetical protein
MPMTTTSVNAFAFLVCVVESAKSLAPVFAADAEIMDAVDHRIVDTIAAPPILTSSQSLACVVERAKSLAPVYAADAEIMDVVDHRIVDTIAAPPMLTSSQSSLMDVPSQAVSNGGINENIVGISIYFVSQSWLC